MSPWIHIVAVAAIVIYSIFCFIKQKRAFHILIVVWALTTLLRYVSADPTFTLILGIVQVVMFIIVVYLMFKRRGERRMNTLELISKMAADGLPEQERVTDTEPIDKDPIVTNPEKNDV